jgi:hypothetical protein
MKCPACQSDLDGPSCELGSLGRLRWFRCRYCGMDFSKEKQIVKPKQIKSLNGGECYVPASR